jgi:hypothetical protein
MACRQKVRRCRIEVFTCGPCMFPVTPPNPTRQDRITGKTYLERGLPVLVLIRWSGKKPRNVLIQRADGTRVVRPFRGLRVPTPEDEARWGERNCTNGE